MVKVDYFSLIRSFGLTAAHCRTPTANGPHPVPPQFAWLSNGHVPTKKGLERINIICVYGGPSVTPEMH